LGDVNIYVELSALEYVNLARGIKWLCHTAQWLHASHSYI